MDAYALAYKLALKIREDGKLEKFVADRYATFDSGYGEAIENGKIGFKELEKLVLTKLGEPVPKSGRQEYLENLLNTYLH
jgi:xylose isomerase